LEVVVEFTELDIEDIAQGLDRRAQRQPFDGPTVVVGVLLLVAVGWFLIVAVMPSVFGSAGDYELGDYCARDEGEPCVLVQTDEDCSWVPLMRCTEWRPVGDLEASADG